MEILKVFFFLFCENKGNSNFMLYHVLLILFSLYIEFDECHSCISMEIWNIIKRLFQLVLKLTVKGTFSCKERVKPWEDIRFLNTRRMILELCYLSDFTIMIFTSFFRICLFSEFAVIGLTYILPFAG